MTRLGIFGGSFDPPHLAHLRVATSACDHLDLDRILWIPAGLPPHKQDQKLTDTDHRVAMTAMMVQEDSRFEIDLRETRIQGPAYSVTTLTSLRNENPSARLYLILGEDQLRDFASWRQPEEILSLSHLLCYHRSESREGGHYAAEDAAGEIIAEDQVTWLPGDPVAISSTDIRDAVGRGESVKSLVSPGIEAYIKSNGLYLAA